MLNPKSLGLAGGLVYGLGIMVMTLMGVLIKFGVMYLSLLESVFPLYSITMMGSIIGLVYGFLFGFVFFYALGYFYVYFEDK